MQKKKMIQSKEKLDKKKLEMATMGKYRFYLQNDSTMHDSLN